MCLLSELSFGKVFDDGSSSMKDICITLVATNEKKQLETCFATLFPDIAASELDVQVVVVDNASTDGVGEWLKDTYPQVTYIRQEENNGFGASHNIAMDACTDAAYYFILNPDTSFTQGTEFLKHMKAWMDAHPKVGMAGPKIFYPDGSLQYSCYRFPTFLQPLYSRTKLGRKGSGKEIADKFQMKDFDHNSTIPVDWIMGSAMFVRKAAIDAVGGFDDVFWMYAEDSDWCRRMWEAGWPVYYVHDITLSHVHGRASAKVPGVLNALIKNKYARVHLRSWMKYFWKWRGNHKYYGALK